MKKLSMKAALLVGVKNIQIKNIPIPEVKKGTVLIKVKACGVCGSDLKFFNYGDRVNKFPAILGHEISGEVVEIGDGIKNFNIGDRIVLGSEIPCKHCETCKKGLENICDNLLSIGTTVPGGFSEYMLLSEPIVERCPIKKIPDNVPFDEAALSETLACVINGMDFVRMRENKDVLIIGTGPIGCMMINVSQILGASKIVAVDKNPKRIDMARIFCADHYIYSENNNFLEEVLKITNGKGYEVVVTACSDPGAYEKAILAAAKGGFVNLFSGVAKGLSDTVAFPHNFIHYRQVAIGGSFSSTKHHLKRAIDYLSSGKINSKALITHKFPLDDINKAFDLVQNQKGLKVLINP